MKNVRRSWGLVAVASVALAGMVIPVTLPAGAQETKLAALEAEAKAKPKDFAAAFALGRAYRRAGRYAKAKTELTRAASLAIGPSREDDAVRARYELVVVEWDSGSSNPSLPQPATLPACKQVKVGKSGEALARVCAAEAWLGMERIGMAEDELTVAEKLDAGLYETKLARAHVAIAKPAHDDAIAKLRALTTAVPGRADAWLDLGRDLIDTGKRADAIAPLRKAKELDPDWPEISFELSRALPEGVEARDLARAAAAMRPTWPGAHVRVGELELATGGYDAAKTSFETAIKLAPKLAGAQAGLAWSLVKLKKFPDAKKAAQQAIALAANHPGARLAMGEAQAGLGETDEAVESFRFAHGLDDKDPTGLFRAVEVLLEAKQPMKAEAHADGAVKAFPDDARAWKLKGDAELANGDKKEAKKAYEKALSAPKGTIDKPSVQKKLEGLK